MEIVSELLYNNIINRSGYMEKHFLITDTISLSPKDVREVQLAKSAIRAGIDTLIHVYGINEDQIDKVYIAGGFGKHIKTEHLFNVGILSDKFKDKVEAVGNTSLSGTYKYLFSNHHSDIHKIIDLSESINLSDNSYFQDKFIEHIKF